MSTQIITLEMVEDAEEAATEQEGYADDAEGNVEQTDNELAEAEDTADEARLEAELEAYQQEAEAEREEAARLREVATDLRTKYEQQNAPQKPEVKPVTFTVPTSLGDVVAERGEDDLNDGYIWHLQTPWTSPYFAGTQEEAKAEMKRLIKAHEKADECGNLYL